MVNEAILSYCNGISKNFRDWYMMRNFVKNSLIKE